MGSHNRGLTDKIQRKFESHTVLNSKHIPNTPDAAEREYLRIIRQIMKEFKGKIKANIPELKQIYLEEVKKSGSTPNYSKVMESSISRVLGKIGEEMDNHITSREIKTKVRKLSNLTLRQTTNEWAKSVKNTLGIDIRKDYYKGAFYNRQLEEWSKSNVDLIKSIPNNTLSKMQDLIKEGFLSGRTGEEIAKDIEATYQTGISHARFLARDQVSKLNADIQRAEQIDAGVSEYIWMTTGDQRVRSSHAHLNGKKFRWDDPPVNDDGRRCHPGEDYGCRCVAIPIFNKRDINLPLEDRISIE